MFARQEQTSRAGRGVLFPDFIRTDNGDKTARFFTSFAALFF